MVSKFAKFETEFVRKIFFEIWSGRSRIFFEAIFRRILEIPSMSFYGLLYANKEWKDRSRILIKSSIRPINV